MTKKVDVYIHENPQVQPIPEIKLLEPLRVDSSNTDPFAGLAEAARARADREAARDAAAEATAQAARDAADEATAQAARDAAAKATAQAARDAAAAPAKEVQRIQSETDQPSTTHDPRLDYARLIDGGTGFVVGAALVYALMMRSRAGKDP